MAPREKGTMGMGEILQDLCNGKEIRGREWLAMGDLITGGGNTTKTAPGGHRNFLQYECG